MMSNFWFSEILLLVVTIATNGIDVSQSYLEEGKNLARERRNSEESQIIRLHGGVQFCPETMISRNRMR